MIRLLKRLILRIRVYFLKRRIKRAMRITVVSYIDTIRQAMALLDELPAMAQDEPPEGILGDL